MELMDQKLMSLVNGGICGSDWGPNRYANLRTLVCGGVPRGSRLALQMCGISHGMLGRHAGREATQHTQQLCLCTGGALPQIGRCPYQPQDE